ncbi:MULTISPECIES: conjugal transfer protein TraD [unclassified Novosphingobium]|uniref:conjugal transfer protein TraD n=1 Tax=unclassified Novosphingobium TaxID=2644732 RepID=UPI0025E0F5B7|nr:MULTISPECIES: conjugal transfer protein TraD [unclassified Novosphingobium]HQV03936.1 conjugal transfer protein TraD [Novosphingobium sp.]
MRKPRDFDSELKALADKAKALKERRVRHLGELVIATGGDTLEPDVLAGALLNAASSNDSTIKEGWRARGAAFFQGKAVDQGRANNKPDRDRAGDRGEAPA